ncbi:alpha/beta fold hydrolase [Streptomyces sp. SCSIO 75703]|uniref:lipase family alpha/beta hydrolase n=1 Tax=Streptomyces sp. SCSIO 75703 TaxID=3112165 RepID=UPI0030CB29FB
MKVTTAAQPLLPLYRRLPEPFPALLTDLTALPGRLTGISLTLLKATALEVAVLAGHVLLYPSGIVQERRPAPPVPTANPPDALLAPPAPRLPVSPGPPVVLLHGFFDNRSVFLLLRRALAQQGRHRVESVNFSPLTCDVRVAAALLDRHVEEICRRTGSERVDIVGHSLGGLIARYYAQRLGGDRRVRVLVTLGTPHAGTRVVPLADAHPIVRQMRPGSDLLEELAQPAPGCRTRFVSFWSDLDHVIDPMEAACLDHPDLAAHNVRVSGIGHLALPVHPAVATRIRQVLDTPGPLTGPASGGTADGLTVA